MSWDALLSALVAATKTLSSTRLLLLLFLIASTASYFVSNGDARITLVASIATLALLFVISILNIALSMRSAFMRLLAATAALISLIVFFSWVTLLSLYALGVWKNCLPLFGDCPPDQSSTTTKTSVIAECRLWDNAEMRPPEGDSFLASQFPSIEASKNSPFETTLGNLFVTADRALLFRNADGDLWDPNPNRKPDATAQGRFNADRWGLTMPLVFVYDRFPELIRSDLDFALARYRDPKGMLALGINNQGSLVAVGLSSATDPNGTTVRAQQVTVFGECVFS
jgi:hypothetical protein